MKNHGGKLVTTMIAIVIMALAYGIIAMGADRAERAECETWKSQSVEYKGFYLTNWQKEQCDAHGIHIEAVVR